MSKLRQSRDTGDSQILVRSYAVTHPRNLGLPPRAHPDWDQLAFASHGVMTVATEQGAWVVPPHRAVWIPAGVTYGLETSGRVTLRSLFFRPRFSGRALPRTCLALNVSPLVRELVVHAALRNTLRRDAPADRRLARLLIDQLAASPQEPLQFPMPLDPRAATAARLLLRGQSSASSLAAVAREAGSSRRTLERLFLRETSITLGRWRRRARFAAALRLLADGTDVTTASAEVGYQTPSAFIAAFRRELGTTPGRYLTLEPSA